MATQDSGNERVEQAAFDRTTVTTRRGSVAWVLVVAAGLAGAVAGLIYIGHERAELYILILLAVLATVGVFSLFAIAAGLLRTGGADGSALLKSVVDSGVDGALVTDSAGRVIYANAAYLALIGADDANDVRPIERVFIGDPEISESIYRLLKAAREGRRLQEEVRVPATKEGEQGRGRWLRLRVRPLGESGRDAKMTVWSIADVSRERERHENVFQELQHAIDYLDHAPAGFFSVDGKGDIVYLNATLAGWLDHDLAQFGSGGLKLADIVAGDGGALLTTLNAAPGEVKTEVVDLDLKTRGGKPLAVRLFHKVAFARGGRRGRPAARRRSALHAVFSQHADGDRHGRQNRRHRAAQSAVRARLRGHPQGR